MSIAVAIATTVALLGAMLWAQTTWEDNGLVFLGSMIICVVAVNVVLALLAPTGQ